MPSLSGRLDHGTSDGRPAAVLAEMLCFSEERRPLAHPAAADLIFCTVASGEEGVSCHTRDPCCCWCCQVERDVSVMLTDRPQLCAAWQRTHARAADNMQMKRVFLHA